MSVPTQRHGPARHEPGPHPGDAWSSPQTAQDVYDWMRQQPLEDDELVVSLRGIADGTGISLPTVRRAVRRLLDSERLVLVRRGTGGRRYSSRYRFTSGTKPASVA